MDDVRNEVSRAATDIEDAEASLLEAYAQQQKFSDELPGAKRATPGETSGFDATKVNVTAEQLDDLNITKAQWDKIAEAMQEANLSTNNEQVIDEQAAKSGESDDDEDDDEDERMGPADGEPLEKAPETAVAAVAATPRTGQTDPAQGSKRSGTGREDDNTFSEFAASLGEGAGNEEKYTLCELGPKFEAFYKAKKQRTQNIIKPVPVGGATV